MSPEEEEVEEFIREAFRQNYELLKLESGHALTNDIIETALMQTLYYWRKLRDVAERVTETEVRLNYPGQKTSKGRKFGIEGVVDIVRDDEKTVMYDIKTHDASYVRTNKKEYEDQLDIYAHIWHNLRGQPLDETAIIATAYPDGVKDALEAGDEIRLEKELETWDPLVEIEVNPEHVKRIVKEFGEIVDCIEEGKFDPAPLEKLKTRISGDSALFATRICRNCDTRFSCESYREYAMEGKGRQESALREYLTDYGQELDQQEWFTMNLEAAPETTELD